MTLVKEKKKYVYSYPENKGFNKYLITGDKRRLAVALGLSVPYVIQILNGDRKMLPRLKSLIVKYGEINKMKDQVQPE